MADEEVKDGTDLGDQESTTVDEKEIDVDSMSDEEIEKFDLDSLEESEGESSEVKSETEVEEEGEQSEAETEEAEETEGEETESEKSEEAITHDPLKDTKAALTREQQKRAELERELAEIKKQMHEERIRGFEELTADELDELKYDDPDAYVDYMLRQREIEQSKKSYEIDAMADRQRKQYREIERFAEAQGVDVKSNEKLSEFLESDRFRTVDKFVTENFRPSQDGLFTVSQMDAAWKALFVDDIVQSKAAKIREETLSSIEKAKNGGSKLDRIPKSADSERSKPVSELSIEDIDNLTEKQVDEVLKELEETMK